LPGEATLSAKSGAKVLGSCVAVGYHIKLKWKEAIEIMTKRTDRQTDRQTQRYTYSIDRVKSNRELVATTQYRAQRFFTSDTQFQALLNK